MSQGIDVYVVYELLKRLTTPFNEMKAHQLGIIDEKGALIKKPTTREEKNAYTALDRVVVNLKRLMSKIPGGESRVATYAAAIYLLKENESDQPIDKTIEQQLTEIVEQLSSDNKYFNRLQKEVQSLDEIANVAGGVAGLGENPPVNKGRPRSIGRYINGVAYLKRKSRERIKKYNTTQINQK
jgi:hypothetical protein